MNVVVLYLLAVATICNRAVAGLAFVMSSNLFVSGPLAAPRAIRWGHHFFLFLLAGEAWLSGRLAERFFLTDFLTLLGRGHLTCGLRRFGGHAARWATVRDAALFAFTSAARFACAGVYPLFFEPALEVGSGFCFADSHYLFFFFFLLLPQLAAPTFRHLAMAPEAYALGKTR